MIIKQIPNHPYYYASENGNILSNKTGKWKVLKASKSSTGYYHVSLYGAKKRKVVSVHTLVLMAFEGMPKPHEECRHKDGTRYNNQYTNLKWGTHEENMWDRNHIHKTSNMPSGLQHWKNRGLL